MRRILIQAALLTASVVLPGRAAAAPAAGRAAADAVEIKTSDGQVLRGSFYKPAADRSPGVLLVHDAGGDHGGLEAIAERLQKQGFGVLAVDLRGHGASRSEKLDWAKLSETERKATWSFAQRDVDAAAEWLLGQASIHSTNLSLVGYGSGCALVVRHAKRDENVVSLALLAPNPEDYGFDVRADIRELEGLPTYVVAAKEDEGALMAMEANATSGARYVELFISPPKLSSPLEDKALPARLAKWMAEKAIPKKGR